MTTTLMPRTALYLLLASLLLITGCSTAPKQQGDTIEEPFFTPEQILGGGVTEYKGTDANDPWQGFNRTMYRFNYHFDKYIFLPAVIGYFKITPDPVEKGIHNFFRNIQDLTTLYNSILQLNLEKTMNTTTRLLSDLLLDVGGQGQVGVGRQQAFDLVTVGHSHHRRDAFKRTFQHCNRTAAVRDGKVRFEGSQHAAGSTRCQIVVVTAISDELNTDTGWNLFQVRQMGLV